MKLIKASRNIVLLVATMAASPSFLVPAGGLAAVAGLSSCSSPAQRQNIRQETRIESRAEDRYDRRRR